MFLFQPSVLRALQVGGVSVAVRNVHVRFVVQQLPSDIGRLASVIGSFHSTYSSYSRASVGGEDSEDVGGSADMLIFLLH